LDTTDVKNYISKALFNEFSLPLEKATEWLYMGASLHTTGNDQIGQDRKTSILSTITHPSELSVTKMYSRASETGGDIDLNSDNFKNALSEGYYFINQVDHGDRYLFCTGYKAGGGGLTIPEIARLSNSPYFPIIYSFSCDVNNLDHDNVVKHFLSNGQGGAVAFFGNYRTAWSSQMMMDNYFIQSFVANDGLPLGEAHRRQVILLNSIPYSASIVGLSGTPFITTQIGETKRLYVSIPSLSTGDTIFSVSVFDEVERMPVYSAMVTLSTESGRVIKSTTDHSGIAGFVFPVNELCEHYIGVIAEGYLPSIDTLTPERSYGILKAMRVEFEEESMPKNLRVRSWRGRLYPGSFYKSGGFICCNFKLVTC
jgi:hypothetical protein